MYLIRHKNNNLRLFSNFLCVFVSCVDHFCQIFHVLRVLHGDLLIYLYLYFVVLISITFINICWNTNSILFVLPGRDRERTRIMERRDNEEVIKIQKKWRGRGAVKNIVLLLFSFGDRMSWGRKKIKEKVVVAQS